MLASRRWYNTNGSCTWRLLKCLFWMHLDYPWALFIPLKSTLGRLMISVSCFADGSAFMEGSWGGGGVLVGFTEIQDLHLLLRVWCSFVPISHHWGTWWSRRIYNPGSKTGAVLLRRKCSQAVHPTHTFSSRQPQSKSLPPQTAQAVPGTERSLSLMVHFVGKSLFLILAGSISLVGLGLSSCAYPGGRMTLRRAWWKTSSCCYLNANPWCVWSYPN